MNIKKIVAQKAKLIPLIILMLSLAVYFLHPFGLFTGPDKNTTLRTETLVLGKLTTTISSSGQIEAENQAIMSFLGVGRVGWIGVKEGEEVKQGQALASLDATEANQVVSKAEAAYKSAQSAVDKVVDDVRLWQYGNSTTSETQTQKTAREQAQMSRDSAYQELQRTKKELEFTSIIAPFDGTITDIKGMAVGQNIGAASQSTITIIGTGNLKFVATVDETEFNGLYIGQNGEISLDAFPDIRFPAQISKIGASAIKLTTGGSVVPVELSLPFDERLKNGLNGEVEFTIIGATNVLSVLKSAIKKEGDQQYVYVQTKNGPQKKNIVTGQSLGNRTEIVSGLSDGEIIILSDVKK